MIVGQHTRDNDLVVNVIQGKKLTNIRAAGKDENVILTPPMRITLERAFSYIEDDELVEATPKSIRLRKRWLDANERKKRHRIREAEKGAVWGGSTPAGSSARTVTYGVAPGGVARALGQRPLHGGEVFAEYAPHQIANRAGPGPGIHEGEDLKVPDPGFAQCRHGLGPRARAHVIDVVGAFHERVDASRTMQIDVEDDILGKCDPWPSLRAYGLVEDRCKRHAQLADVLKRQPAAGAARSRHPRGALIGLHLERRSGG